MKIIDLTQPLYDGMPVYPGDPEVVIKRIHTLDKEGWRLSQLSFSSHIGTHVNAPYHMAETGVTLDNYKLDDFIGKAQLYKPGMEFDPQVGIIFSEMNIDQEIAEKLMQNPPKFIGLSEKFEFDVPLEKKLLEQGLISFENLANTEKLPEVFTFYGIPLLLKSSDGSPVRAFAVIK